MTFEELKKKKENILSLYKEIEEKINIEIESQKKKIKKLNKIDKIIKYITILISITLIGITYISEMLLGNINILILIFLDLFKINTLAILYGFCYKDHIKDYFIETAILKNENLLKDYQGILRTKMYEKENLIEEIDRYLSYFNNKNEDEKHQRFTQQDLLEQDLVPNNDYQKQYSSKAKVYTLKKEQH